MPERTSIAARQRGLSLVELLVGVAVGLFIVGGATKMLVDNLDSNRRALLETRVSQDLRAAADLIARDLRRAGYWQNALTGIWGTVGVTPPPNPHCQVEPALATSAACVAQAAGTTAMTTVEYSYAKNNDDARGNAEQFGFRVAGGVLQYQSGKDNWQPVTDPNSLVIDGFAITETRRPVRLFSYCTCMVRLTCNAADFTGAGPYAATQPITMLRQYDVRIRGAATADASVRREIRETVRVRNDHVTGVCPDIP